MKKCTLFAGIALAGILIVSCGRHKQAEQTDDDGDFAFEEALDAMDAEEATGFTVATDDFATSEESRSGSSTNWDKVLDEYERYVDKYIALLMKAQNGDLGAMSEYTEMLESANSFASLLADADDMTSAQMARYIRINQKVASAAAKMQNASSKLSKKAASWLDDDDDDDDDWF